MDYIYLGIYSIIQGVTEFLPISSSAHLMLLSKFWGIEPDVSAFMEILAHIGSLAAIILFMRHRIWGIMRGFFSRGDNPEKSEAWKIAASFVPIAIVGAFMAATGFKSESIRLTAIFLIVFGIILWAAERFFGNKTDEISWKSAMAAGFMQCFAAIHGASRSGTCMSGLMMTGVRRKAAAEFAFLMAIPAIAAAGLSDFIKVRNGAPIDLAPGLFVLSLSFIASYAAIGTLMRLVQRYSFAWAAAYRIILGALLLILF